MPDDGYYNLYRDRSSFRALRSVVPTASLDSQFARVLQLDLQLMKTAVCPGRRNKAQQIVALRACQLAEAEGEVAPCYVRAAGPMRQVDEHERIRWVIVTRRPAGIRGSSGAAAGVIGRLAGVHGVDRPFGANGSLNQFRFFARAIMPYMEPGRDERSEEHTSELQSLRHLVCRL